MLVADQVAAAPATVAIKQNRPGRPRKYTDAEERRKIRLEKNREAAKRAYARKVGGMKVLEREVIKNRTALVANQNKLLQFERLFQQLGMDSRTLEQMVVQMQPVALSQPPSKPGAARTPDTQWNVGQLSRGNQVGAKRARPAAFSRPKDVKPKLVALSDSSSADENDFDVVASLLQLDEDAGTKARERANGEHASSLLSLQSEEPSLRRTFSLNTILASPKGSPIKKQQEGQLRKVPSLSLLNGDEAEHQACIRQSKFVSVLQQGAPFSTTSAMPLMIAA